MYSRVAGSCKSLEVASTSLAYCLPMAIWRSRLYQLPTPRAQPRLRTPMASISRMPRSLLLFLRSGLGADCRAGPVVLGATESVWVKAREATRQNAKREKRSRMFAPSPGAENQVGSTLLQDAAEGKRISRHKGKRRRKRLKTGKSLKGRRL